MRLHVLAAALTAALIVLTGCRGVTTNTQPASDMTAVEPQMDSTAVIKRDNVQAEQSELLAPVALPARDVEAAFTAVQAALDQMQIAVSNGDYKQAEAARLDAYAKLESGPEARIKAFAPQDMPDIEGLFWQGNAAHSGLAQLLTQKAHVDQVASTRVALEAVLAQAREGMVGHMAPQAAASNAALIVFREGLEAVLILASLMASLRYGAQRRMRRPLWLGAALALGATVATWFLARSALASLARYGERLEAAVSFITVVMLLLVLNWFFQDVYWKDWMAGFHQRKQRILRGNTPQWLGLMVLGFASLYREGFESVIFLQALVLEAGAPAVLTGIAIGLGLTLLLGLAVFGLQRRLPHKKMLVVTGVLIGAVLLQMVGNLVHSFQVVGWISTHPIGWLKLPEWLGTWFGIYATWEGIGLQALAAVFTIGSYVAAEHMHGQGARLRVQGKKTHPQVLAPSVHVHQLAPEEPVLEKET